MPAPSGREPLARPQAFHFSRKLYRYAKGPILEGAVCVADWGSSGKLPLPSSPAAMPHSPFCRYATSSPGRGKSALKGTAFGGGGKVSGIAQRRPLGGAGCERSEQTEGVPAARLFPQETSAVVAVSCCVPSREKAIPENPQIFRNCEIINHFSAEDAQSNAERILNRPGSRTPAVLQKRRDVL